MIKLSSIKNNPNNPRTIDKDKLEKLKKSIKAFERMLELRPMVVDENNVLLGGNMRKRALKELGYTEIPENWVVKASDLTEEQKNEFIIKDNVGFGSWDWETLANEWDAEQLEDWGLDIPGFDSEEQHLEAEEDDYQQPEQMQVDVVLGDLIEFVCEDGRVHRLLCGDSTDSDAVARLMNKEKADMVFTDPPYGYNYESNYYKSGNPFGKIENDDKILNFMPNVELFTLDNAAIFVCTSFQVVDEWVKLIKDYFKYKNLIVWKKNNWSMGDLKGAFAGQHELIIFSHKGRVELKAKRETDIWEFDRQAAQVHPTQKPVKLISYAIKNTCNNKANILDLFGGSGSTMVAAHQTQRTAFLMELDEKYCQVIIDRMQALDEGIAVKINGKEYKKEAGGDDVPF